MLAFNFTLLGSMVLLKIDAQHSDLREVFGKSMSRYVFFIG